MPTPALLFQYSRYLSLSKLVFFSWGGGDSDIIVSLKFKRLKIWIKLEVDLVIKLGIIWQALEAYYHNGDVF